ncbi:MAG TPA: hypothetical protein VGA97_07565 [Acidimicrobiia bacterium]
MVASPARAAAPPGIMATPRETSWEAEAAKAAKREKPMNTAIARPKRRRAPTPTRAPIRTLTVAIPMRSTSLSLVPKVAMANSLTGVGTLSMTQFPIPSTKEGRPEKTPASNSETPRAIPAARPPASASRAGVGFTEP